MKTRTVLMLVPAVIITTAVALVATVRPAKTVVNTVEAHPSLAELSQDIDSRLKPALVHVARDSAERAAARPHRVHLASR